MKKRGTLIPILALAIACQNVQEAQETPVAPLVDEETDSVFYATMESQDAGTKVYADGNLNVRWDAEDHISIFRKDTGNREYIFSGETGENSGAFVEAEGSQTATVEPLPYFYAVYPYSSETEIDTDGTISLTFPEEQFYRENTFGRGASPMVAVAEDHTLMFKNAGTFLAVQLYGDGISVTGITFRGNKHEKLAGPATITTSLDGNPGLSVADEGTSEEVRIVCAEPVPIGSDSEHATVFWFVLPPTAFEDGFTVLVEDSEGNIYRKTSTKERTLARNHLLRMQAFQLVKHGFGIYPATRDPYVYDSSNDQMNIYEAEGNGWFRFLHIPDLTMYELGPIPLDETLWSEGIDAQLVVTRQGVAGEPVNYTLTVRSYQNGILKLATADGDQFIIRF